MYEHVLKELKSRYNNKLNLSAKETAEATGIGYIPLLKMVKDRQGVPPFKKIGSGKKHKIFVFPIFGVARFISDTEVVVK